MTEGPMATPPSDLTPASGWTTETLHVHLTAMLNAGFARIEALLNEREKAMTVAFAAQEKAMEAALAAAEKAVLKAETAANDRFESVNEFRAQLNDQAALFMPRAESLAMHKRAQDDISELKERAWQSQGATAGTESSRHRLASTTNIVIAVVGVGLAVLVIVLNLVTGSG